MKFIAYLVAKMPALFSSEYRDLKNKVKYLSSNKKQTLKNHAKLEKELLADLQRRIILKESIKVLSEIYNNLKYGASVVSLSEFHGLRSDLNFNKYQLEELELKIKEATAQRDSYSKELLEQTEEIKNASQALEKFGVLVKI
jgi:chromosome segregation ATPase